VTRKLLCCALLALGVTPGAAAPVPDADRVPIDLRRTTLIVRDMDNSLRFYRDALGLKVVYDNIIRTPRTATSDEAAQRSLRLVFVQANDDFVGIIGLIEYRKPLKQPPAVLPDAFSIGTSVLLFNAKDLDGTFARARAVPGVTIVEEPVETSYPGYDGKPPIPVRVSTLRDPDGFTVELNQLLVDKVR
jgi:catechol 2,3-dioxygenase-like lactoylglutathione lyase family enzyme